ALVAVELLDFFQLFHDHGTQFLFRAKNGLVFSDVFAGQIQLFGDFIDGELGQAMQLQFKDRVRLNAGERFFRIELGCASSGVNVDFLAGEVSHQIFAGFGAVGAGADDNDDIVQVIQRGQIAFEDVFALFRLHQEMGGAAAHHVDPVI